MAPKPNHVAKMIAAAEEQLAKSQEALAADPPPDAATAAALMDTVEAMLAKIERLQAISDKIAILKKHK